MTKSKKERPTVNIAVGLIKSFTLTGVDRAGKRFKITVNSYTQACMYNLYRGSLWADLDNGTRKLLKREYN